MVSRSFSLILGCIRHGWYGQREWSYVRVVFVVRAVLYCLCLHCLLTMRFLVFFADPGVYRTWDGTVRGGGATTPKVHMFVLCLWCARAYTVFMLALCVAHAFGVLFA